MGRWDMRDDARRWGKSECMIPYELSTEPLSPLMTLSVLGSSDGQSSSLSSLSPTQ